MDLQGLLRKLKDSLTQSVSSIPQNIGNVINAPSQLGQNIGRQVIPKIQQTIQQAPRNIATAAPQFWQGMNTPFGAPTPQAPKIPFLGQTPYEVGQTTSAMGFTPELQVVSGLARGMSGLPKLATNIVAEIPKIAGPWGQGLNATMTAWKQNAVAQGVNPKQAEGLAMALPLMVGHIQTNGGVNAKTVNSAKSMFVNILKQAEGDINKKYVPEQVAGAIEKLAKMDWRQARNVNEGNLIKLASFIKAAESGVLSNIPTGIGLTVKNIREGQKKPLNQGVSQTINDVGATKGVGAIKPEQSTVKLDQPLVKIQSAAKGIPQGAKTLMDESVAKAERVTQKTGQKIAPLENVIQQSGLDVKKKVNLLDLARTPDRIMEKVGLGKEMDLIRKADEAYRKELPVQIEKITQWAKQVSPESNQRIFQYLDGKPVELQPNELKVAGEIQGYLKSWADRLGLPVDKRISNYITHIFPEGFIQKEFDPDLAKIIDQNVAGSVYDPFTLQRLGKLGYREDTWAALDAYVKRATRKVNMDPALKEVSSAAKNLELESYKYVKGYVDRLNLRPIEIENLADNLIKSTPIGYSLGQRPTNALTQKARQMIYRGTLGLNVGSAIKNLTQGVNTYAKLGEKYTLIGYTNLFKNFRSKELEQAGVLTNDLIQDRTLSATKKLWERVDRGLFSLFETAEKINRGAAYYGAKAKALNQGLDEGTAIDFAKKMVRDTQFTFGAIDTPPILQSDIGKTLLQFQSFNIKQAEFLGEMVAQKDVAGLLRWTLASLAVMGTVGQAIGMKPQDLIPTVRVGGSPLFTLANDIGGAITQARDQYGNVPSMQSRLKRVGNDIVPFIPGGVQLKKLSKGQLLSGPAKQAPQAPIELPTVAPAANAVEQMTQKVVLSPTQKAVMDQQIKSLTEQQKQTLVNTGWQIPFLGQIGGLTEDQRNQQYEAIREQIKSLREAKNYTYEKQISEKISLNTSRMTNLKDKEDYAGWLKVADDQLTVLQDQYKAATEEKDKLNLENKITDLKTSIDKYKSYGGFTRPKAAKKPAKITIKKAAMIKVKLPALKAGKITIAKPPTAKKITVTANTKANVVNKTFKITKATVKFKKVKYA